MFSEDVLTRLSELNRQRVSTPSATERSGQFASTNTARVSVSDNTLTEDVSQLPQGEESTNAWGAHWMRRRCLRDIWSHGDLWLSDAMVRLDQRRSVSTSRSRELRAMWTHLPDDVLYLDLETCGFAGSMVFLIGLIHRFDGQFLLTQLLARNYAEEKAMLQTLWTIASDNRVLVTFNGKSFDWPMVHDRSTVHHLGYDVRSVSDNGADSQPSPERTPTADAGGLTRHDPRPDLIHCDLLHHARRRWKSKLPDCKLQTLERHLCRRHRTDDIPGREIPAAYHDFVRSRDAWLMRSVLHHNALDLVTLLQLSMLLLS